MLALLPLLLAVQTSPTPLAVQKQKMQDLSFIEGAWTGGGWQMRGEAKDAFSGTEKARYSAGGTALVIEGRQTAKGPDGADVERYNGLVVITWNGAKNCYRIAQQTSSGSYAEYEGQLADRVLSWKLREDIALTLTVTDGEWIEQAVMTKGDLKSTFFELRMRLAK